MFCRGKKAFKKKKYFLGVYLFPALYCVIKKVMDNITQKLTDKLQEFYSSFISKDWSRFSSILSDEFSYFGDNMTVMNKVSFVEFLSKDKWNGESFEVSNLTANISAGDDLGVLAYHIFFRGSINGKSSEVSAVETMAFIKENSDWKIIHCHVSNRY